MVHSRRASAFARSIGVCKVVTAWWLIPTLSCHRPAACAFQTGNKIVGLFGQQGHYRSSVVSRPKGARTARLIPSVFARILPANNGYGPAARSHLIRSRSISLESTSRDVSYFDETWGHLLDYEVRGMHMAPVFMHPCANFHGLSQRQFPLFGLPKWARNSKKVSKSKLYMTWRSKPKRYDSPYPTPSNASVHPPISADHVLIYNRL
jgi:hypothetical protein